MSTHPEDAVLIIPVFCDSIQWPVFSSQRFALKLASVLSAMLLTLVYSGLHQSHHPSQIWEMK
jgi:hypothetical protein